jgi:hypothetical protein
MDLIRKDFPNNSNNVTPNAIVLNGKISPISYHETNSAGIILGNEEDESNNLLPIRGITVHNGL